jgi:hypothetical protein
VGEGEGIGKGCVLGSGLEVDPSQVSRDVVLRTSAGEYHGITIDRAGEDY